MKDTQTQTRRLLNQIYKGADMGGEAISIVGEKVKSGEFSQVLASESAQYSRIYDQAEQQLKAHGAQPSSSGVGKISLAAGINMQVMKDKSESALARILIEGSTMGISEMHDAIARNPSAEQSAIDLANQLADVSNTIIEDMKRFL